MDLACIFWSCRFKQRLNVLNQPPVFDEVLQGRAPPVQFTINGTPYNMGYYLADGIYLDWLTFVKTIPMSQGPRKNYLQNVKKQREKGCGTSIWCAQISIRNYMWFIACLEHRYNEGYNVGMHYIA